MGKLQGKVAVITGGKGHRLRLLAGETSRKQVLKLADVNQEKEV